MSDSVANLNGVPSHLGLILDGNRRWAKAHKLSPYEGHREGYANLKTIAKAAINKRVQYVSAFIFSTENWNRTPQEVKYLMDLTLKILEKDVAELSKENIRVVWLGDSHRLSKKMIKAIAKAEKLTANNTKGTLALCFNYGGKIELLDAVKNIVAKNPKPKDITPDLLESSLYHPEIPPIDLLIRTSGEQRLSGFMLYRAAYAELMFVKKHWPAFKEQDLYAALAKYQNRQRRFGS